MRDKFIKVLCLLTFRLILEISYIYFLVPEFRYEGFEYDFNLIKYFVSWSFYLYSIVIIKSKLNKPSDFFFGILVLFFQAPVSILYAFNTYHLGAFLTYNSAIILISLILRTPNIRVKFAQINSSLTIIGSWIFAISIILVMIVNGGLSTFNLDLEKVYDYRAEVTRNLNFGPFSYFNLWLSRVIGPVLLSFYLFKRAWTYVFMVLFMHVLLFGLTSHKSILFYPLLILGLYFLRDFKKLIPLFFLSVSSFILLALLFYIANNENVLFPSLVIRRSFFIPAHISYVYYDFFTNHDPISWSNSFLNPIVDFRFNKSVSLVIGDYMGSGSWANNSFLASGYSHAKSFGVFIYAITFAVILKLIDSFSFNRSSTWIALSITIVPVQTIISNADLTTGLVTHGLFLSLVYLYLLKIYEIK